MAGAWLGDLFMSPIATSRLIGTNPPPYRTTLLRHLQKILEPPSQWNPWNYQYPSPACLHKLIAVLQSRDDFGSCTLPGGRLPLAHLVSPEPSPASHPLPGCMKTACHWKKLAPRPAQPCRKGIAQPQFSEAWWLKQSIKRQYGTACPNSGGSRSAMPGPLWQHSTLPAPQAKGFITFANGGVT